MSKLFRRITNVIIGLMTVLIVLFTAMGIVEILDGMHTYTVSETSMLYAIEDGRYGELVDDYHRNMAAGAKTDETMEECYAVARYYEALIDLQIAVRSGSDEAAEECRLRMEAAEEEMGELSFAKSEIDQLLAIE